MAYIKEIDVIRLTINDDDYTTLQQTVMTQLSALGHNAAIVLSYNVVFDNVALTYIAFVRYVINVDTAPLEVVVKSSK